MRILPKLNKIILYIILNKQNEVFFVQTEELIKLVNKVKTLGCETQKLTSQ